MDPSPGGSARYRPATARVGGVRRGERGRERGDRAGGALARWGESEAVVGAVVRCNG